MPAQTQQPLAPLHCEPTSQPRSVRALAERLLTTYTVEGGNAHLAGCTLEDRPLLRLTVRRGGEADQSSELFFDSAGRLLDVAVVRSLGLCDVRPLAEEPPKFDAGQFAGWQRRAIRAAIERHDGARVVAAAIVWCKYTEGTIRFEIGDASLDLPFADWARALIAPPLVCPHSGIDSFRVAATDDGRIAAAEAIAACEQTGERGLADELVRCEATGKLVAGRLTSRCPVAGSPILNTALVDCTTCGQQVSPGCIQRGVCAACRRLAPVGKCDPRMARLLDAYPGLDHFGRWKMSETRTAYILSTGGLFRRLLVVLEKETLHPLRIARRAALARRWSRVETPGYDEILRPA